ncbi:hypothetical protein [Sediminitomix flava]|uniref:Uncharacterized protein n=1 Tax=Sediminitomix flava TaxID=379075 RepID=A0A315ZIP2_SEDFL|nr:hypothetical protein [Sediminitomix flava]PWJ33499.1 hypothetical protein BC781_1131 [Sediminitomix flava]
MNYKNPFFRTRQENFSLTLNRQRKAVIFIILAILAALAANSLDVLQQNILIVILIVSTFIILLNTYFIYHDWIIVMPNEVSVMVDENKLVVEFPKPKKDLIIPYSEIDEISFNKLAPNQESIISFKSENLLEFGIDIDSISVSSLSEANWKAVCNKYKLPLRIAFDLFQHDERDIYVIQKELETDKPILKSEFQELLETIKGIKLLGVQEFYHLREEDIEYLEQYSFETKFGLETLDFSQGILAISYMKNKPPKEVEEIVNIFNWSFKKI